ncbi:MAG: 50S ribosomal protein L32 [Deltaproteobacteria bacterium]|nr:50S ribosomal protein L32 [Deltaproteobacteria bacterium]
MAVPKKKISKSRGRSRRAHYKCHPPGLSNCTHCKSLIAPHRACPICGYYKGKEIVAVA